MDQTRAYWVSRLNKNAQYEILSQKVYDCIEYADGGIISDSIIQLKSKKATVKARLIFYKDPESGKVLSFISNLFDYNPLTIANYINTDGQLRCFLKG
jgi:hypothetical protein